MLLCNLGENRKRGISNKSACDAVQSFLFDRESQTWCHCKRSCQHNIITGQSTRKRLVHTWNQNTVRERIHCPYIRSPVSVTQASREREESLLQLEQLAPRSKGTKRQSEHAQYANPEFESISKPRSKYRPGI